MLQVCERGISDPSEVIDICVISLLVLIVIIMLYIKQIHIFIVSYVN